jgi:exodeoxyribonuclease III
LLKIISWNILQGGGSRVFTIANAIIQGGYDVAILSEFRNNASGQQLKAILLKAGYLHQVCSHAIGNDNTIFIASKHLCQGINYTSADENFSNNIITAQFEAFNIMGVYLPHKKKNSLLPFITKLVGETDIPYIITGDYNIGHNFIDQKGDSFWYQTELKAFEKTGYVDAFRLLHGSLETYSWFSHQGNGYRYDHTYVHPHLIPIVKECFYIHEWRQNKLSDHAPMVLHLG